MTLPVHCVRAAAGLSRYPVVVTPNPSRAEHKVRPRCSRAFVAAAVCGGRLWSAAAKLPLSLQRSPAARHSRAPYIIRLKKKQVLLLDFGVRVW